MTKASMETLARRMRGKGLGGVAAQAAYEARKRFAAGETGGCSGWEAWVRQYVGKVSQSRIYHLIKVGAASDPEAVQADITKHKTEYQRERRKQKKQEALVELVKRNLGPRIDTRDYSKGDDVERQLTNLQTVWNNSPSLVARTRYLTWLGVRELQVVETDAA